MDGISSNGFQWFSQGEICRSFIFPQQQNIAMGSLAQVRSGAIWCDPVQLQHQVPDKVPEVSGADTS